MVTGLESIMAAEPKTLQEAILYFADPKNCREYLVAGSDEAALRGIWVKPTTSSRGCWNPLRFGADFREELDDSNGDNSPAPMHPLAFRDLKAATAHPSK